MASADPARLSAIAQTLLEDVLHALLHETVLHRHRRHKLLVAALDPVSKLPLCETCNLPRVLEPALAPRVRGAPGPPPKDTVYCERRPWARRAGHDIYDNPFPKSDVTGRPPTKREREAAAARHSKKDGGGDGTPASEEAGVDGTAPPSPTGEGEGGTNAANNNNNLNGKERMEKGEKKANKIDEKLREGKYVPWHTCPSCKRSLLITRFAKHLEQCMGLAGRAASRHAMARMNGSTPAGSRGATPNPPGHNAESRNSGEVDDDEDDEAAATTTTPAKGAANMKKKLLKKGVTNRMRKDRAASSSGGANGARPKGALPRRPPPASNGSTGAEKRDREEMMAGEEGEEEDGEDADGDDADGEQHVKKRRKLQRTGSTASAGSQSTVAPLSALEMDDGSFVDEGSVADE